MDINCTLCDKQVARGKAFYVHEHTCCSIDCVKHIKSTIVENKSKSNDIQRSAFTYSFGGGSF